MRHAYLAFFLVLSAARPASAQIPCDRAGASDESCAGPVIDLRAERASATSVRDVGAGLTVTAFALGALGGGLFGLTDWAGVISGGTVVGLGGLFLLSGVPTWIVGAVRDDILNAHDRLETGERWEIAGAATFVAGLVAMGLGIALIPLASDVGANRDAVRISGFALAPVGLFTAMFVGLPMWVEGARF